MGKLREMPSHNTLHGLLFQATGAEYVVLCTQMYQLARHALLSRLGAKTFRNPAVIFDLDETLLDNSEYHAWQLAAGTNFDEQTSWKTWCNLGRAKAVPGAVEFVRFVLDNNVTPIFITSRQNETRKGTAKNLVAFGLLSKDEATDDAYKTRLFMKGMGPVPVTRPDKQDHVPIRNKFEQRIFCEQVRNFEVVLSVGDSLADYAEYYGTVFDKEGSVVPHQHPSAAARRFAALQDLPLFGRDFILIPNSIYGGWLRAFEANSIGAGDELAQTGNQVREPLREPQDEFDYESSAGPQLSKPLGRKFSKENLAIWKGPTAAAKGK
jgi:predicted secreted acid phosphatase